MFSNLDGLKEINKENIVLIPKIDHPHFLRDFHPISLCNVSFKIVSKVIANHFKSVMGYLASENQYSFISERHGLDNTTIAQEAIHSMRTKKGQKGLLQLRLIWKKHMTNLIGNSLNVHLVVGD